MKLLLHTCCAPCAIYPAESAKGDGFDSVTGFFYNPNIHPSAEFLRRRGEAERFFASEDSELIKPDYSPAEYFDSVNVTDSPPARCVSCWRLRIDISAAYASLNGFAAFTTTLLASPYQDHEALKKICSEASTRHKVDFYYRDFRFGFKEAHKKARESGIYCQNYCGCMFSLIEREESRKAKTAGAIL